MTTTYTRDIAEKMEVGDTFICAGCGGEFTLTEDTIGIGTDEVELFCETCE